MITEQNWREMFTVQEVDEFNIKTETVGECNENCLEAKERLSLIDRFSEATVSV
jgi:hypothetical protein